jgi:CDP-diacylglycerol pyrophosphatase
MNYVRGLALSLALGLIACGLTLSGLGVFAASPTRQALWQAVRGCVLDFKLTGVAFPCLFIDLTAGEELGYVVLRAPFGPPDTVLVPTRRVIGVEDPWLQSPNSPNYFDAAWRARPYLKGPDGRSPQSPGCSWIRGRQTSPCTRRKTNTGPTSNL